ncbi:MAG: glycosyltransferase family 87 protein [Thermogemmata sp.]|nr:glycosyltransferase family 87 protein [Thermogemmata sp.]
MLTSDNVASCEPFRVTDSSTSNANKFPWLAATLLTFLFVTFCLAIRGMDGKDFLELSLLASYALKHGSPYKPEAPGIAYNVSTTKNSELLPGFIYPPSLIPVILPFSLLPYAVGVVAWFGFLTAAALMSVYILQRYTDASSITTSIVILLLFSNSIMQSALLVGQAAILIVIGVVVGIYYSIKRRWLLAGIGWSLLAIKPQIGIPFLAVATVAGGKRGLVIAVASVTTLTLIGAIITGAPIEAILSYLPHVSETIYKIQYNRVTNDQVVSWNRAVYLVSGYEINLPAPIMVIGFTCYLVAVAIRERWPTHRISSLNYWLAAAAVTGPVFGQAKGYDLVVLILWFPYILEAFKAGHRRIPVLFLIAIIIIGIPRAIINHLFSNIPCSQSVLSYRMWICLSLAIWLIARGPNKPYHT